MNIYAIPFSILMAAVLAAPVSSYAGEPPALIPLEKDTTIGFPLGLGEHKKNVPEEGRVNIGKDELPAAMTGKKDPLVRIEEPKTGIVARSFQTISGRVGGGISKAFLRVNGDTQVVSVVDGKFEAYGALKPGLNSITALAWDLEGNLGKDSLKVFYKPDERGPKVEITSPADGSDRSITRDRVITLTAKAEDRKARDAYIVVNGVPLRVSVEGGIVKQDLALFPGANEIYVEVLGADGRAGRSRAVRVNTFDARPKDLVAVLTWDSRTADLDLHVWDSFGHHTFGEASDPENCEAAVPGGTLDMDRKGNFGPEVFSLEGASPEVYSFFAKYNPGLKDKGSACLLRLLINGGEPSRRILRSFGPARLDGLNPAWEAARVKMPEGVFFQEKESDLARTLGMDGRAVRRLALMLDEENPAFRLLAISAMGQIKNEEAVPPLVKALEDGSPEIRRAAAGALHGIKSLASVPALEKALGDHDPEVRRSAAAALGNIGYAASLYSLTGLLAEEGDPQVRAETLKALGRLGEPRALDSIISQAQDKDPVVRVEAARALGGMDPARLDGAQSAKAGKVLSGMLSDKEAGVREIAASSAGSLKLGGLMKLLMDALRFDAGEGVRVWSAKALGAMKDKAALPELEYAMERDASDRVRFCARKAIEGMEEPVKPAASKEYAPLPPDEDLVIY